MRDPNSDYAVRLTIESSQKVEPGIAVEAFSITDCTEEMTEEEVDQD